MSTLNTCLLWPMGFYVFYIMVIGLLNFRVRYSAIVDRSVSIKFFKTYQESAPEKVLVWGRHYDNQFELPLLFFITCLTSSVFGKVTFVSSILAWLFVGSRLVHSYIHVRKNNLIHRALAFFFGWGMVAGMWIQILLC